MEIIEILFFLFLIWVVFMITKKEKKSQIVWWIDKMFKHSIKHRWYKTYWFVDLHGVISKPDYRNIVKTIEYYPYAKETLQYISEQREDIVLILFTSSHKEELEVYTKILTDDGINFRYINENPEISDADGSYGCYDKKPYYNVLLDDKAGFDPYYDWFEILNYLGNSTIIPNKEWAQKTKEDYHKFEQK